MFLLFPFGRGIIIDVSNLISRPQFFRSCRRNNNVFPYGMNYIPIDRICQEVNRIFIKIFSYA
nr:MAG TPA_asm: hypothetical protein [Caudoviricetes sp.]